MKDMKELSTKVQKLLKATFEIFGKDEVLVLALAIKVEGGEPATAIIGDDLRAGARLAGKLRAELCARSELSYDEAELVWSEASQIETPEEPSLN